MKNKLLFTLLMVGIPLFSICQSTLVETMEKRARKMHSTIVSSDREQWKKFVLENYTQALIDKPMQSKVVTVEGNKTETSPGTTADKVDSKVNMFNRLHSDFGNSEIISLKPDGEKMQMTLKNKQGLKGVFTLQFEKKSPWLIDGVSIEAQQED